MVYKNKNGEIPIRKIADKVMNSYRDLIYTHRQIEEERAELNYAEKQALQELPQFREKITNTEAERERGLRLISELQQKRKKEEEVLIGDIRVVEEDLKKARRQRQYYEQIGIEELIRRVSQEEFQNQELERMRIMKSELTRAYQDVLSKYRSLTENLEIDFRSFENNKQSLILKKELPSAGYRKRPCKIFVRKKSGCVRHSKRNCKR